MPPLPRLRIGALDDLARQLRYAPREALDRHIASAEQLAGELDPAQGYPEDWFIFRLTGYRPDISDPASLVGEALLGDLSALVERLSIAAGHTPEDAGAGALTIERLCERWSVSRKTVERYRRRGLIARRVLVDGKTQRLAFPLQNVEVFEQREQALVDRASSFTRIDDELSARMLRRARRYRASLGLSLNETAARLASRFDRSHEGVRQVLRRADERAGADGREPLFSELTPPGERERRVVHRAVRRGIEPSEIASRTGRARVSVVRSLNQARADLLLGLDLDGPVLVTFEREEAREVLLASEHARSELWTNASTDLSELVSVSRVRASTDEPTEQARAIAYHYLRWVAKRRLGTLSRTTPSGELIDECETLLRWAARLKILLIQSEMHLVLASFDRAGIETGTMPGDEIRRALRLGIEALGSAVDRFDPSRGARLAAPCALALARVTGRWAQRPSTTKARRAAPRLAPGTPVDDWTRSACPWQRWLDPDPRLAGVLDDLDERDALILRRRFALDGRPPETLSAVADLLGTTRVHAARFERAAIRAALDRWRESQTESRA